MHITSRDNSLLREARAVRDGKADDLIFVEGLRLCVEALRSNLEIEAVIASEELVRKEKAAETFAILLPLASRSTILHMAAICGASFVRKSFPV